ncbi:MAG: hypothetical protein AAGN66_25670 [Acidobacteriota bacterium]
MSRITLPLLVVLMALVSFSLTAPALADADAAVDAPADECFTPDVKRCCKAKNAPLAVPCEADGEEWTCYARVHTNDLYKDTKRSDTGWKLSRTTGNVFTCKYQKVSCGDRPYDCNWEDRPTTETCKEKEAYGGLCESVVDGDVGRSCF